MAKTKPRNGVQNRPLYSRVSFLYQAAVLLTTQADRPLTAKGPEKPEKPEKPEEISPVAFASPLIRLPLPHEGAAWEEQPAKHISALPGGEPAQSTSPELLGVSRRLSSDVRAVSLKTQMRVSPAIKRTLCKFCDALLVEGVSCTSLVENKSRGGRKPWADVLVIKCNTCGKEKRFPVDAQRQKRRPFRGAQCIEAEGPGGSTAVNTSKNMSPG